VKIARKSPEHGESFESDWTQRRKSLENRPKIAGTKAEAKVEQKSDARQD